MTADPVGLAGGINLYSYVENNPINLIDPEGLESECYDCEGKPKQGSEVAKSCCANEAPMSNTARNPYGEDERYMFVSARLMFQYGGNGPWGNIVRGCLVCMLKHGAGMHEAHMFCYGNATDRTTRLQAIAGYSRAMTAGTIIAILRGANALAHEGTR